jgi:hypothetical protein
LALAGPEHQLCTGVVHQEGKQVSLVCLLLVELVVVLLEEVAVTLAMDLLVAHRSMRQITKMVVAEQERRLTEHLIQAKQVAMAVME